MSDSLEEHLDALGWIAEGLAASQSRDANGERDFRWLAFDRQLDGSLDGRRVVVVGGDAHEDAVAFAARGARQVLACDPGKERVGAQALADGSPVQVEALSWHELDPSRDGTFEIVLCDGLLHRVTEPLKLLQMLRSMTAPGGMLLIGSMMIADPERSEYLRFVPGRYAGDPTWWFLPGRLAFRWLVETAGFEVQTEFGEREGPRDLFPVIAGYLRATAR